MTASPKSVRFDDDSLWIDLTDGWVIAVPLTWFPRLLSASPQQREQVELSRYGLHWEALDEDISVAGWLACWRGRATLPASIPRRPELPGSHCLNVAVVGVNVRSGR